MKFAELTDDTGWAIVEEDGIIYLRTFRRGEYTILPLTKREAAQMADAILEVAQ